MKPPNLKLRRRSTGQLSQETLQQLGVPTDHPHPMSPINENPRSSQHTKTELEKQSSLEVPVQSSGISLQRYLSKKRGSLDVKDTSKSKMASTLSGSTSTLAKKKKSNMASLLPPMIGSRPSSPSRERCRSPQQNDASDSDSASARLERSTSSSSRLSRPSWNPSSPATLSESPLQREITHEEEMELYVKKITIAAHHWRDKYVKERSTTNNLQQKTSQLGLEYSSKMKACKEQYEAQLFQLRNKLIMTIESTEAIAVDNQRLVEELQKLQEATSGKCREMQERASHDSSVIARLERELAQAKDSCVECQQEKDSLLNENESLISRIMEIKTELAKRCERQSEKWDDYYTLVLDLALTKLNRFESCTKEKTRTVLSSVSRGHSRESSLQNTLKRMASSGTNSGSQPVDAASNDSLSSLESMLSDMTEVYIPKPAPAVPSNSHSCLDINENETDLKSGLGNGESFAHLLRPSRRRSEQVVTNSGSEYNMASYLRNKLFHRNSPASRRRRFSGIKTSFSDSNLCDFDSSSASVINPGRLRNSAMDGRTSNGVLPRKPMIKSSSQDGYEVDPRRPSFLGSLFTQSSQSQVSEHVPQHKKFPSSPKLPPKQTAKKNNRPFSIKLEMPRMPWKRRNTTDTSILTEQEASKLMALSSNARPVSMKASFPSSPIEDSCIISCRSSITSSSSVEVEHDAYTESPANSGYSGIYHLNRRRNGILPHAQIDVMAVSKKAKTKRSEFEDFDKKAKRAVSNEEGDSEKPVKNKFFKRKSLSVKR